jgi:hypothetical protein
MPTLVGGAWNRLFWEVKKSYFTGHLHPLKCVTDTYIQSYMELSKGKEEKG